jgi:hypothetical protein
MSPAQMKVQTLMGIWERNVKEAASITRVYGDPPKKEDLIERLNVLTATRKNIENQIDAALVECVEEMDLTRDSQ